MVAINGKPLSFQVTADNNPTSFDAIGLPPGLSINAMSGVISGTPTQSGTYTATISAANSTGTGYANLTITVASAASDISYTYDSSTTWTCPANVTAVQVECWGAGGAGGSGSKPVSGNAFGGGGAGGAYAKKNTVPVVPGSSYTLTIGTGGVSALSPSLTTVPGGDTWFGSATNCLAKGGAGGQSVISSGSGIVGTGGSGSSAGSVGDVVYAGGSGLAGQASPINAGGGGGGSAGASSAGTNAASYLGATAVTGGGAGGNGKDSGNGDGSPGGSPGGGGGGARGSSVGSQSVGGTGGNGRVVLTVQAVAKATQSINFVLEPSTATAGTTRILSATATSLLPVTFTSSNPAVATVSGSTLTIIAAGSATITATQAGDSRYDAAVPVEQVLTVTSAASGFSTWNGNSSTMTPELLSKYAIGGAVNSSATGEQPFVSLAASTFSLTAVVRTDDPKLTITPRATTSLGGVWDYPVATTGAAQSVSQANVPVGCERKVFTLDRSTNTKIFIRLETGYTP
jgi:hypothetical protein